MTGQFSIRVNEVSKKLGPNQALAGVALDFAEGKMHGIIGPEGAGKTTLMRCLLGLLRPDAGSVEYREDGAPLEFDAVRSRIAYMPQQQSLYPDLSIDEHLEFFRALYQIPRTNSGSGARSCSRSPVWVSSWTAPRRNCRAGCTRSWASCARCCAPRDHAAG